MSLCVIPGSFDPVTRGHVDLIIRASRLFDRVVVAVLHNPDKAGWLTFNQRIELLKAVFGESSNVTNGNGIDIQGFEGLLVDFAAAIGADAVVRGVRTTVDFEYESSMAVMNRELSGDAGLETIFLPANPALAHLSSSIARQVAVFGGSLDKIIPNESLGLLKQFIQDNKGK
ncbi:phosphopantetheine adenylyltransferase [Clostridia bacterium]|nr:phosphopantetheine adenylyltransferase [Clostridia bacterium]